MALHLAFFIVSLFLLAHAEPVPNLPDSLMFSSSREVRITSKAKILSSVNSQSFGRSARHEIIDAAITMISQVNPNVFIQRNILKIDAVKELETLRARESSYSNFEFHHQMMVIFSRLDDLHTVYIPTPALGSSTATLLVDFVEYYKEGGNRPCYMRGDAMFESNFADFPFGSDIISLNGQPVGLSAYRLGRDSSATNFGARLANSEFYLTNRPLSVFPMPAKDEARIRYKHPNGTKLQIRVPWTYITSSPKHEYKNESLGERVVNPLFDREQPRRGDKKPPTEYQTAKPLKRRNIPFSAALNESLSLEIITANKAKFARFSIRSFEFNVTVESLTELLEVVGSIKVPRLVVDIRENGGGASLLTKVLFEIICERTLPSTPYFVRATEVVRRLTKTSTYRELAAGVRDALRAGEQFSGPMSDLNKLEDSFKPVERFFEPVFTGELILLFDGSTYSAGDLFAAWFKDQEAGVTVGVHSATGGGGATVLEYDQLAKLGAFPGGKAKLPNGVRMTTAFSRLFRSGEKSGAFIENRGVTPDVRYFYTKFDAFNNDDGLFNFIGSRFKK